MFAAMNISYQSVRKRVKCALYKYQEWPGKVERPARSARCGTRPARRRRRDSDTAVLTIYPGKPALTSLPGRSERAGDCPHAPSPFPCVFVPLERLA